MRVKLLTNLRHDGKMFEKGQEIDLEDEAAQQLLESESACVPGAEGVEVDAAMEISNLRAELEDAEAAVEGQKQRNAELGVQCEMLDDQLVKVNAENRDLHSQIESLKKEVSDLKKQLAEAKKAVKAEAPDESGK